MLTLLCWIPQPKTRSADLFLAPGPRIAEIVLIRISLRNYLLITLKKKKQMKKIACLYLSVTNFK